MFANCLAFPLMIFNLMLPSISSKALSFIMLGALAKDVTIRADDRAAKVA